MRVIPKRQAYRLRSMTGMDLPQVMGIEARAYPFPWPEAYFRLCLREGHVCRVLARGRTIEAYGVMALESGKAHILNLCVRPESQRQGLGSWMLNHLLNVARRRRAHVALLEVRPSNYAARTLYQRLGFSRSGIRKDYYPAEEGREDAFIMMRPL